MKTRLPILTAGLLALVVSAPSALACAACYGRSDSSMAQGMNWGIMTLLGVVGVVLGCVASFFVFIGRRAAHPPSQPEPKTPPATKF